MIRAAVSFVNQGLGTAILVGREDRIHETAAAAGIELAGRDGIEIHNARLSHRNAAYAHFLYERLQRKGYLFRDCQRLINQDRNHFAASHGGAGRRRRHGDRPDPQLFDGAGRRAPRHRPQARPPRHRRVARAWRADAPCSSPTRPFTRCPTRRSSPRSRSRRPAWRGASATSRASRCSSFSTFGQPQGRARARRSRRRCKILDGARVDFEYDGEMAADVALNRELMAAQYPFCRLPGRRTCWSCRRSTRPRSRPRCCRSSAARPCVGPLIVGLDKPVQIVSLGANDATSSTWRRWRGTTSGVAPGWSAGFIAVSRKASHAPAAARSSAPCPWCCAAARRRRSRASAA